MVACDLDDDETSANNDTTQGIKSVCEQAIYDSIVTDEYVYSMTWDKSTGLIKTYKTEVYTTVTDSAGVTGKIMNYRMQGYSYRDISQLMNVKEKFVDNSLRKSRRKIITLFD